MLSMPEIDGIRRMDREGATPAEIARATNHDPKTVRKYIEMDDFSPKPPEKVERPSILDPHKPFIDEILTGDLKVRRKQCHSGTRIFERLRDLTQTVGPCDDPAHRGRWCSPRRSRAGARPP